ncbi:hypothetical protein F5I97DRAFT_1829680 [Phlebopus sp. FC_14]|nr:hypothetical protein F5I97DRAFT_1829680 [Phlebopus sp. FC_14]
MSPARRADMRNIRENARRRFLNGVGVVSRRMDELYEALEREIRHDHPKPQTSAHLPVDAGAKPTKPLSALEARRQKRAEKKAVVVATWDAAPPTTSTFTTEHSDPTIDIDLHTVNISVNDTDLVVDAHLRLKEGIRYGLVGQNGVGKTVLMKCMAEDILAMPNNHNLKILHIAQLEVFDDSTTAPTSVLEADKESMDVLCETRRIRKTSPLDVPQKSNSAELNVAPPPVSSPSYAPDNAVTKARQHQLELETEYADLEARDSQQHITAEMTTDIITEIVDRHALIDLDAKRASARKILRGIGFREEEVDAPVGTLSANHLDRPAILWLQEYLKNGAGRLDARRRMSHNREFSTSTTSRKKRTSSANKTLSYHAGNFSDYIRNSEELRGGGEGEDERGVFHVVGGGSVKRWDGDLDEYVESVTMKAVLSKSNVTRLWVVW